MAELLQFQQRQSRFTREPFATVEPLGHEWLVKGLMPSIGLGFIVGSPGAGKSFASIDFLLRIASGRDVLGRRTRQVGVAYVASEAANGVRKRLKAWRKQHGNRAHLELIPQAVDLRSDDDVDDLKITLRDMKADLEGEGLSLGVVVIDTLAASMPGADENGGADMSDVVARVQRLVLELGLLVILVAHTGKDESRGIRGWSGMTGAADMILTVERDKDDPAVRIVTAAKIKEGEDGDRFAFRLESVFLGYDGDNDEITSAVPAYEEAPAKRGKAQRALSDKHKLLLRAVAFCTEEGSGLCRIVQGVPGVKPGTRGALRSDIKGQLIRLGFADADDTPASVKRAINRLITDLIGRQLLRGEGDLLWEV